MSTAKLRAARRAESSRAPLFDTVQRHHIPATLVYLTGRRDPSNIRAPCSRRQPGPDPPGPARPRPAPPGPARPHSPPGVQRSTAPESAWPGPCKPFFSSGWPPHHGSTAPWHHGSTGAAAHLLKGRLPSPPLPSPPPARHHTGRAVPTSAHLIGNIKAIIISGGPSRDPRPPGPRPEDLARSGHIAPGAGLQEGVGYGGEGGRQSPRHAPPRRVVAVSIHSDSRSPHLHLPPPPPAPALPGLKGIPLWSLWFSHLI